MKVHDLAAQFDTQFIISNDKLDDVGVFSLVCDRPFSSSLEHVMPARYQGKFENNISLCAPTLGERFGG
jgi:hypothetical protein